MFKPIGDRIVVEPEENKATDGGILLPDSIKNGDVKVGTVLAAGDGHYSDTGQFIKNPISVGDKVLFGYSVEFNHKNTTYHTLRGWDVFTILEK